MPAFVLGAIGAQYVNVGGQLYVGEVLAALLLLPLVLERTRLPRFERHLFLAAVLWAVAQALSDIHNQTSIDDSLKGVFAPLVFVATILGLIAYFNADLRRMPSFLLGVSAGTLASFALFPTAILLENPWKYGVGGVILTVLTVLYSFFLHRETFFWLFATMGSFLMVSLYYDSRSMAIMPVIAGVGYLLAQLGIDARLSGFFRGKWGMLRLLPLIVAAAFLLNLGTTALFTADFFLSRMPATVAQKYEAQARGSLGLLLGGRPEVLASARAFVDEPLLGHGSWARDTGGYRQAYVKEYRELGYEGVDQQETATGLIPTHSYLMGALVWSGVVGGLFWVFLLYGTFRRFIHSAGLLPLYFYIGGVGFLWNVLFSPFGASARWSTAVFLSAFLVYTQRNRLVQ